MQSSEVIGDKKGKIDMNKLKNMLKKKMSNTQKN